MRRSTCAASPWARPPAPDRPLPAAFSHCSSCGHAFADGAPWPRKCAACGNVTHRNPLPVAVLVLPVHGGGVVGVRRAGGTRGLALPGGFVELGESWQEAAAREAAEETGVAVDPERVELLAVRSAPDGTLLVFGTAPPVDAGELAHFTPSAEVEEVEIVEGPSPRLVFPLHAEVVAAWFAERSTAAPGG